MASSPPRRATLLLLSLLLLAAAVDVAHAARKLPSAASSRGHAAELQGQNGEVDSKEEVAAMGLTAAVADDPCGGGGAGGGDEAGDDECLMRRTLVAHTDYIYTQGGSHN